MIMQPYPLWIRLFGGRARLLVIGWDNDEGGMRPIVTVKNGDHDTVLYRVGPDEQWAVEEPAAR